MKRIPILVALVMVLALMSATWAVLGAVFQTGPIVFAGKGKGLAKDQIITGRASADEYSIRKGDAFHLTLEVLYDPTQVTGIDRANLDKSVDVKPFEIRNVSETEFPVDGRTRVYRRQYELQLIDGAVDQTYQLSTMVVRYSLKNANGYAEKAVVPDPIPVAARLTKEVGNLELRPITDKIDDPSRDRAIAVLAILGGLLVVGSATDLVGRVIPQWRAQAQHRARLGSADAMAQAYRSLVRRMTHHAEPQSCLRQLDHLLRWVLAEKGATGWLEETDLDRIPEEIRPAVAELLEQCQRAYGRSAGGRVEMERLVQQLDTVLEFYVGTVELAAWRN